MIDHIEGDKDEIEKYLESFVYPNTVVRYAGASSPNSVRFMFSYKEDMWWLDNKVWWTKLQSEIDHLKAWEQGRMCTTDLFVQRFDGSAPTKWYAS